MDLKEGIIVKTINYKETSKIIYLITDEGLVSLEVKGANRVNGHSHLYANLLTKIAFSSSKHFFSSGEVLDNYVIIKSSLERLKVSLEIMEMSYTLGSHIADYSIFYSFLSQILDLISTSDKYLFYCLVFYIKSLYLLGINPQLNKCVDCGKKEDLVGFVFRDGGMKCHNCLKPSDIIYDNNVINDVIMMYYTKLDNFNSHELNVDYAKTREFIDRFYNEYLGFTSKSSKILAKIK